MTAHTWQPCKLEGKALEAVRDLISDDIEAHLVEIENNRAELFFITGPGYAGHLMTRVEQQPDGDLVLVPIAARGFGYGPGLKQLKAIARANGIRWVRVHSERKGYERLASRHGFRLLERLPSGEVVMICEA